MGKTIEDAISDVAKALYDIMNDSVESIKDAARQCGMVDLPMGQSGEAFEIGSTIKSTSGKVWRIDHMVLSEHGWDVYVRSADCCESSCINLADVERMDVARLIKNTSSGMEMLAAIADMPLVAGTSVTGLVDKARTRLLYLLTGDFQ